MMDILINIAAIEILIFISIVLVAAIICLVFDIKMGINEHKETKLKKRCKKMMTLEEAIQHCLEKANGDCACAEDHKQLAEWLMELAERRRFDCEEASDSDAFD